MSHDSFFFTGWAMSQPLPVNSFEWVVAEQISTADVMSWENDAAKGYILEVCILTL